MAYCEDLMQGLTNMILSRSATIHIAFDLIWIIGF